MIDKTSTIEALLKHAPKPCEKMNWLNNSNQKNHSSRHLKYINDDIERVKKVIDIETVSLTKDDHDIVQK